MSAITPSFDCSDKLRPATSAANPRMQFPRLDGHGGRASGIILRRLRQTRKFHSRRDANWRPRFGDRGPISRLRLAIFPLNLRVKFNHLFGSRIFGLGRGGHKSIFDDQMRPHAMAGDVLLGRCCAIFLAMSPDQRANTAAVRVFGTLGGRLPKPPIKPWRSHGQDGTSQSTAHQPEPMCRHARKLSVREYRLHKPERSHKKIMV